jgi:hypothetical protein
MSTKGRNGWWEKTRIMKRLKLAKRQTQNRIVQVHPLMEAGFITSSRKSQRTKPTPALHA